MTMDDSSSQLVAVSVKSSTFKVIAMRYAVVIESAGSNFSAYVPDLPGGVATGATMADTEVTIREAMPMRAGSTARCPSSAAPRCDA